MSPTGHGGQRGGIDPGQVTVDELIALLLAQTSQRAQRGPAIGAVSKQIHILNFQM